MKRFKYIYKALIIILSTLFIGSCEDYFEFSPYASNVKDSYKNIGEKNLERIIVTDTAHKDEVRVAVIADSHYNYHELSEAITDINSCNDIDFVVVNGDIADHGYLKEYELFHENMDKLHVPYITVIGNHDYRSNGEDIYKDMFGAYNKSFVYNNNLFILFDDVFWESNKNPDIDWLEEQLEHSEQYDHILVFAHIPPYTDQFTVEYEKKYKDLMLSYNVDISVHGHIHKNKYGDYYGDGMIYLAVGTIVDKEYSIITISNSGIELENINY